MIGHVSPNKSSLLLPNFHKVSQRPFPRSQDSLTYRIHLIGKAHSLSFAAAAAGIQLDEWKLVWFALINTALPPRPPGEGTSFTPRKYGTTKITLIDFWLLWRRSGAIPFRQRKSTCDGILWRAKVRLKFAWEVQIYLFFCLIFWSFQEFLWQVIKISQKKKKSISFTSTK